ncbi:MAG: DNA-binding protein [Spirochaetaceae bacterium]|jgi:hypothetical protein|nr:DNA-binding protein [Spirochaetaceae bacterium]
MNDFFTSADVAAATGMQKITVIKWAANNDVKSIGAGNGKTYLWTAADIERFKARDTKRGRRWNKD